MYPFCSQNTLPGCLDGSQRAEIPDKKLTVVVVQGPWLWLVKLCRCVCIWYNILCNYVIFIKTLCLHPLLHLIFSYSEIKASGDLQSFGSFSSWGWESYLDNLVARCFQWFSISSPRMVLTTLEENLVWQVILSHPVLEESCLIIQLLVLRPPWRNSLSSGVGVCKYDLIWYIYIFIIIFIFFSISVML